MSSLNKVCLIGNVGKDPEIRKTNAGKAIANLTLATSEKWTDKQTGQKAERTEWHRIVIFNERLAEIVQKFVAKGDKLYIEGALQTRKWVDKSGKDNYTTEVVLQAFNGQIVMLGSPGGKREPGQDRDEEQTSRPAAAATGNARGSTNFDDDIPF